jgi:hypothetical protein
LNVAVFFVSGMLGFKFMLQTLYRLEAARHWPPPKPPKTPEAGETPPAEDQPPPIMAQPAQETGALWGVRNLWLDGHVKAIFVSWMIVSGLVCAQMAWVLRPFLGKPGEPFHWFCPRESSFLPAFWEAMRALFS